MTRLYVKFDENGNPVNPLWDKIETILEFTKDNYRSIEAVAQHLNISHPYATRILRDLFDKGKLTRKILHGKGRGRRTIHYCSVDYSLRYKLTGNLSKVILSERILKQIKLLGIHNDLDYCIQFKTIDAETIELLEFIPYRPGENILSGGK